MEIKFNLNVWAILSIWLALIILGLIVVCYKRGIKATFSMLSSYFSTFSVEIFIGLLRILFFLPAIFIINVLSLSRDFYLKMKAIFTSEYFKKHWHWIQFIPFSVLMLFAVYLQWTDKHENIQYSISALWFGSYLIFLSGKPQQKVIDNLTQDSDGSSSEQKKSNTK